MPSLSPSLNLLLGGAVALPQGCNLEPPELPTRLEAETLYQRYVEAVSPIAHVLHIPSFKRVLDRFWMNIEIGSPNQNSCTALVLSVCMAAAASLSPLQAKAQFGITKEDLFLRLQRATERALLRAQWAKTSNIRTLQALTIYIVITAFVSFRQQVLNVIDTPLQGADLSRNFCNRRGPSSASPMHWHPPSQC